jgi:hypothetical protein
MSIEGEDAPTAMRHYRATINRLKARVAYFETRTADLEQMLARALVVADAYEAMLSGVLDRKKPDDRS